MGKLQTARALEAYKKCTVDKEKVVEQYLPLVKKIAWKLKEMFPPNVELDDLISAGIIGLLEALERYNPNLGVKFSTYAYMRIKGAMIDELRSTDWAPRRVRQLARKVEETYARLEAELGRTPTDEEVAKELDMSVEDFRKLLEDINGAIVLSLDDFLVSDDGSIVPFIARVPDRSQRSPEEESTQGELIEALKKAIDELTDQEKLIVTLYYYEDLSFKEIAKVLGVSQSRVSQLHARALLKLKNRLRSFFQ